jgi:catechol-2,3-dioxygenase
MSVIRNVAEVVINARDINAASKFYQDVLGFRMFRQSPEVNPTIVFLTVAPLDPPFGEHHPQVFVIIDPAHHDVIAGKFDSPTVRTSTLNHVAFQIDESSYDRELKRLTELGLAPTVSNFPGMCAKAIFFHDPEGNTLELICHDSSAVT